MAYDVNNPNLSFEDFLVNGQIDMGKVDQYAAQQGWWRPDVGPITSKMRSGFINNIAAQGTRNVNSQLRTDPNQWAQYGIPQDIIQAQFGILSNQASNASGSGLFGSTFDNLFDKTQDIVQDYALPALLAAGTAGAFTPAAGAGAGAGAAGAEFASLPDMLGGMAEANAGLPSAFTGAAGATVAPEVIAQDWSLPSTPVGSSLGFDAASVAAPAAGAAGSGVLPTAAGVGAGTTAAIAGGAAAAPSLYDRLTGGNAQNADYLELLGRVAPAALGAFASNQQANSLENIANKYAEYGAPSRARYEGSFAPGFTMASDPGYQDALDQSASAAWRAGSMGGNPAGNPAALSEILDRLYKGTAYPALQSYRGLNANAGGIASGTAAAPGLDTAAINANTNIYGAIGGGIADVMNPQRSLSQLLAELKSSRIGLA